MGGWQPWGDHPELQGCEEEGRDGTGLGTTRGPLSRAPGQACVESWEGSRPEGWGPRGGQGQTWPWDPAPTRAWPGRGSGENAGHLEQLLWPGPPYLHLKGRDWTWCLCIHPATGSPTGQAVGRWALRPPGLGPSQAAGGAQLRWPRGVSLFCSGCPGPRSRSRDGCRQCVHQRPG